MPDDPRTKPKSPPRPDEPLQADRTMPHLRVPIDIALSFDFEGGRPQNALAQDETDPLASALTSDVLDRLRSFEPQVMRWLSISDDNRLLFLSDPIAALQQIDKSIDKGLLRQVQRARHRLTPAAEVDSRVRLSQVRVTLTPEPKPSPDPSSDNKPVKK